MDINEIIERLEHLMYGYNYEVCLGIDIFDGDTIEDFKKYIKSKYPGTSPGKYPLSEANSKEFFDDIEDKFNYRGDYGSGLVLTEEKEIELRDVQTNFFDFIKQFVTTSSKFYHYPDAEGIPGYPVFWEFRYIVLTDQHKILFVYGSSSD